MTKSELQRLTKLEDRIKQIAKEKYKLDFDEPEWDIVPAQKLLEIMSYRLPTQISSWKYGRDYERERTIYDNVTGSTPYEVVINSRPPRAYLMETNVFAVQVLVMAHVIGHLAMFKMNKYFSNTRKDILDVMAAAQERFNNYEKKYGIDAVELIVDAGHALQLHSTPFENETEDEMRKRIYEQEKTRRKPVVTEFSDIVGSPTAHKQQLDIDYENHQLWQILKHTTPPEPMTDILRYIVDHSSVLEDWQKDILEVLRLEGRYFWPMYKTKNLHEGCATCLAGESLIDTNIGLLTIKEIVENKLKVKVFDGNCYRNIVNWFKNENKKRIKLTLSNGIVIHGGENHKLLINDEWIELKDFREGDKLNLTTYDCLESSKDYVKIDYVIKRRPNNEDILKSLDNLDMRTYKKWLNGKKVMGDCEDRCSKFKDILEYREKEFGTGYCISRDNVNIPNIVDEDFALFLGMMIGDGNICLGKKRGSHICFTNGEKYLVDLMSDTIEKVFGKKPTVKKRDGDNRWRIKLCSNDVVDFLIEKIGMKYSYSAGIKEVPDVIFKSPLSVISSFIRGYFDADGCVSTRNKSVILSTKSQKLAKQIQILLLKFGIFSRVVSQYEKRYDYDHYYLHISGIYMDKYSKLIGFNSIKKRESLDRSISERKFYVKKNLGHVYVKEIEEDFGETYDFSVEETHQYYYNGFINHNCFHTKIMEDLFTEGLLTSEEHGQYNYANSLVRAQMRNGLNPYLVGAEILFDVEERYNKGRYGKDYEECTSITEKENWDTKEGKGLDKVLSIIRTYNDWFFIHEFLTTELVDKLDLYLYEAIDRTTHIDYVRTHHSADEIRQILINSFANNFIPEIEVVDCSGEELMLNHRHTGRDLDITYAKETIKHIKKIWGKEVLLTSETPK